MQLVITCKSAGKGFLICRGEQASERQRQPDAIFKKHFVKVKISAMKIITTLIIFFSLTTLSGFSQKDGFEKIIVLDPELLQNPVH
jgi:hypothetical protein